VTSGLLHGRTAVITGASQGLGRAIARSYVAAGASVILCARSGEALDDVARELGTDLRAGQRVLAFPVDVSDLGAVERVVGQALEQCPRIHVLVNNAGVYGPIGPIESVDWSEWVRAVGINLQGSVLPCRALLPHFKAHRYGKIIQLSGGGATSPLPNMSAYAASKAAVVRFAETLAEEVRAYGIDVNSIAPGVLNTRLLDQVIDAGPERAGRAFYERMVREKEGGGTPLQKGADLAVFLASAASDGITGKLVSAVWDQWTNLPERRDALQRSDVYTLRRIVPKDRGFDWE
jgi:3-oxoacyl-[acyl-carrier protein] reductase